MIYDVLFLNSDNGYRLFDTNWNIIKFSISGKKIRRDDIINISENEHTYIITIKEYGKIRIYSFEKDKCIFYIE